MTQKQITDPDVEKLATISSRLQKSREATNNINWENSKFEWILSCPSSTKGKVGREIVSEWAVGKGLSVEKASKGAHRKIEGKRVVIKFSTLWDGNSYRFQQIKDQDYSIVICLGISPFDASGWAIPKDEALKHAPTQHKGAEGTDTNWFPVTPGSEPGWLKPWGGRLSKMYEVLLELCSKPSDP